MTASQCKRGFPVGLRSFAGGGTPETGLDCYPTLLRTRRAMVMGLDHVSVPARGVLERLITIETLVWSLAGALNHASDPCQVR